MSLEYSLCSQRTVYVPRVQFLVYVLKSTVSVPRVQFMSSDVPKVQFKSLEYSLCPREHRQLSSKSTVYVLRLHVYAPIVRVQFSTVSGSREHRAQFLFPEYSLSP